VIDAVGPCKPRPDAPRYTTALPGSHQSATVLKGASSRPIEAIRRSTDALNLFMSLGWRDLRCPRVFAFENPPPRMQTGGLALLAIDDRTFHDQRRLTRVNMNGGTVREHTRWFDVLRVTRVP